MPACASIALRGKDAYEKALKAAGKGANGWDLSVPSMSRLGRCGPKLVIGRENLQKSSRMFPYVSLPIPVSRCFGSFFRSFSPAHHSKISARRGIWHHHRNCGGLQLRGAPRALLLRGGLPSAVPGQTWSQAVLQRPASAGAMANMDFMWCFKTIISNEPRKIWETCEIIVKSHGKSWWKNVEEC